MNIKDLDFSKLSIDSDNENNGIFSRTVYYDPINETYIKKWYNDYFYKKYFEITTKTNFLEGISLLTDILYDDDNNILGYITKQGKHVTFDNLDRNKYRDLIDRVSKKCFEFNIVYLDFMVKNIVEIDNVYYIIDLEACLPIDNLKEMPSLKTVIEFNEYFYIKQIQPLLTPFIGDDPIKIVKHHTKTDKEIKYGTANGRIYLENEYLPTLKGKTLFVGTNYYTDFYHRLTQDPELFETLDILESAIEHGSPYKHYICNVLDFKNQGYLYDNVCLFGVLGHMDDWDILKRKEEVIKCMELMDSLVKPGGTLLLGPSASQNIEQNMDFWNDIYSMDIFKKYEILYLKKIDINYVWYGRKK